MLWVRALDLSLRLCLSVDAIVFGVLLLVCGACFTREFDLWLFGLLVPSCLLGLSHDAFVVYILSALVLRCLVLVILVLVNGGCCGKLGWALFDR